jgi:hypothetical protein
MPIASIRRIDCVLGMSYGTRGIERPLRSQLLEQCLSRAYLLTVRTVLVGSLIGRLVGRLVTRVMRSSFTVYAICDDTQRFCWFALVCYGTWYTSYGLRQ